MAAAVATYYCKKQVECQLRSYLGPRELFSEATCSSILALCGFTDRQQGAKEASKKHVKAMKRMLRSGLLSSWTESHLRFSLVALTPFRPLFHQYLTEFVDEPSFSKNSIQDVYLAAFEIFMATADLHKSNDSELMKGHKAFVNSLGIVGSNSLNFSDAHQVCLSELLGGNQRKSKNCSGLSHDTKPATCLRETQGNSGFQTESIESQKTHEIYHQMRSFSLALKRLEYESMQNQETLELIDARVKTTADFVHNLRRMTVFHA